MAYTEHNSKLSKCQCLRPIFQQPNRKSRKLFKNIINNILAARTTESVVWDRQKRVGRDPEAEGTRQKACAEARRQVAESQRKGERGTDQQSETKRAESSSHEVEGMWQRAVGKVHKADGMRQSQSFTRFFIRN